MTRILVQPNASVGDMKLPVEQPWDATRFEAFCQLNPTIDAELDAQGNLIIMSPSNADADSKNTDLTIQIGKWLDGHPEFISFGPSAGFTLANGAVRSPDGSLVRTSDWESLSDSAKKSFAPVTPFFALELRSSESDSLNAVQQKMAEYIACGTRLAWLIDPITATLTVYRPGQDPVCHDAPVSLAAGDELPGLVIDFQKIW